MLLIKSIIVFSVLFNSSFVFSFYDERVPTFEKEKQKSLYKELKLKPEQIIKSNPPERNLEQEEITEEVQKMIETGIPAADEFLFDPYNYVRENRDPNYTSISDSEEIGQSIDPNKICPARPKRLWEGKVRKLMCNPTEIDSDKNLMKDEEILRNNPNIIIKKTVKELPTE